MDPLGGSNGFLDSPGDSLWFPSYFLIIPEWIPIDSLVVP